MPDTLSLAGPSVARVERALSGALELIGRSAPVGRLVELVRRAAALDGGVLLVAGPGADVESVARDLHARSPLAEAPFVGVECRSDHLERLLFGAARSDASADLEPVSSDSRIAGARGGTLYLQNVG